MQQILNLNKNNCTDCWYRRKVGGMPYCDYFLSTGVRRPCPAGAGCTVKISRKVYRKRKKFL